MLIVEAAQQRVTLHELHDRFIVIPDTGSLSRGFVFENYQPVKSENLEVKNISVLVQGVSPPKRFSKYRSASTCCTPSMM